MIAEGGEPGPDEAIGVAVGYWPSFGMSSGAYVKLNSDGSGTILTGAQECGTGAVMGLPLLAARELGMRPENFSIVYQDTHVGPWDAGASGSQTTFNNGRAVVAAARQVADQLRALAADRMEASADDIELVDGHARVKGSPDQSVPIPELAEAGHEGELPLGHGSGDPPPAPESDASGCVGRLGMESFTAPTFFAHAVRVRLDRDTGIVRVLEVAAAHDSGTIVNRVGAEGQVEGGVVMGIGMALSEGTMLDEQGRQVNTHLLDYKLQTAADVPPIKIEFVEVDTPNAGPYGAKGVAEPPCVPTPGAIGNAIAKLVGTHVPSLPMTPERVHAALHGEES
jgi:CO/xanthine dehydrogenase Mo-binding subunit